MYEICLQYMHIQYVGAYVDSNRRYISLLYVIF